MKKNYFKKTVIHFADNNTLIKSQGRNVSFFNQNLKIDVKLPFSFPRDFYFNISLLKRLFRSDAKEVIYDKKNNKLIVIRDGSVYLILGEKYKLLGSIEGDAPLFNSHCIYKGIIYFGQYDRNKTRKESRIYKIDKNNNLTVVHTFNSGVIRHVHSLINDPYIENRIWITTGDNDGECLLLYTDDDFKSLSNVGDKSQGFRIVNLGFSKDHIFYGTDNLIKENFLYVQNRNDEKREKVLSVKQTAWFLKQDKTGKAIIGTTVENGNGCQVNYSSVYYSTDFGLSWLELIRIPKDIYPMPLFKWGSVSFSNGSDNLDNLYINVESLKYLNGSSFRLGFITGFSESDLRKIEVKKKDYFENNAHLMLIIFRLFSLYEFGKDIRFLNLLLKLIDWMPIHLILEKRKLRIIALNTYENINNSSN